MDTVAPWTRSRMMAGIRGADTGPERLVRSALFARGFRYRINCPDLPGKPDIKLTRYRAVILVHGCFWHAHACRHFRLPASNVPFWTVKLAKNRERDLRNVSELLAAGWRVCIVWECLLKSVAFRTEPGAIVDLLAAWVRGQEPFLELFDAEAAVSVSESESPSRGCVYDRHGDVGINGDEAVFAAERSARYIVK